MPTLNNYPAAAFEIRAFLSRRKTLIVTPVLPAPKHMLIEGRAHLTHGMDPALDGGIWYDADCINPGRPVTCDLGLSADQLYVSEPWNVFMLSRDKDESWPLREVPAEDPRLDDEGVHTIIVDYGYNLEGTGLLTGPWRSKKEMPAWASRIRLEIVTVKATRLRYLSEHIATLTGVEREPDAPDGTPRWRDYSKSRGDKNATVLSATMSLASHWKSLYGSKSVNDTDWVWLHEVKYLTTG